MKFRLALIPFLAALVFEWTNLEARFACEVGLADVGDLLDDRSIARAVWEHATERLPSFESTETYASAREILSIFLEGAVIERIQFPDFKSETERKLVLDRLLNRMREVVRIPNLTPSKALAIREKISKLEKLWKSLQHEIPGRIGHQAVESKLDEVLYTFRMQEFLEGDSHLKYRLEKLPYLFLASESAGPHALKLKPRGANHLRVQVYIFWAKDSITGDLLPELRKIKIAHRHGWDQF